MNCKYKYLIVILLTFISVSSYSQRLIVRDDKVIIETFGMSKDILAVTADQQALKVDGNGHTKLLGVESSVNGKISAMFEISLTDTGNTNITWESASTICGGKNSDNWRLPTLNEALLMVLFFDQLKVQHNLIAGSILPQGFALPKHGPSVPTYATATTAGSGMYYFYRWDLTQLSSGGRLYSGYFGTGATKGSNCLVRCIRDIPQ